MPYDYDFDEDFEVETGYDEDVTGEEVLTFACEDCDHRWEEDVYEAEDYGLEGGDLSDVRFLCSDRVLKNTGPVWQFAKNCVDRFLISVFVLFPQSSVLPTDFNDVYDFYKKGNYDTLVKVSRVALRKEEIDYRILLLYTSAEKDPEEIDKTLRSIYEKKGSHPGIFYNSVFLFLERCLVLEDESSGIYWGKIFSENGTSSVRYAEGLYTYACILYEAGKFSEAKQILIKLRELKSAEKLAKKIRILELSVEKKRSKDVKALKVQAGKLKGKSIETPIAVAGNTNFTPAILKKSVFDIVGSLVLKGRLILEKSVFVDFFAGSGQMALEAMSRGFARVVLYELAWERSDNLRKLFAKFSDNYEVSRKDVFRFYNKLDIPEKSKIYFLDPPYSFWDKKKEKIKSLLDFLLKADATVAVFVQSPIDPNWSGFETRKFGKNFLTFRVNGVGDVSRLPNENASEISEDISSFHQNED